MRSSQSTPIQDAIAVYAHRHSGRTMVQVAQAVCPNRGSRGRPRCNPQGGAERPMQRHKDSHVVAPGPCPAMGRNAPSHGCAPPKGRSSADASACVGRRRWHSRAQRALGHPIQRLAALVPTVQLQSKYERNVRLQPVKLLADVVRPQLHQRTASIEEVGPGVGLLRGVAQGMGKGRLRHGPGSVRLL